MAPPSGNARVEANGYEPEQYGHPTLHDLSNADEAGLGAGAGEAEERTGGSPAPTPDAPQTEPGPTAPPGEGSAGLLPPPQRPPSPLPRPLTRQTAPGTHARPHGDTRPQNQAAGRGSRAYPLPPELNRRSTAPEQETRRGTNRMERLYRRRAQVPAGGANTAGAQAHTHTTGTRRGPEGQPDRARGTHRPHGMAYQQAKERDTRTGQPTGDKPVAHKPQTPNLQGWTPKYFHEYLGVATASQAGAKLEVAYNWARWLRTSCPLGGPHRF